MTDALINNVSHQPEHFETDFFLHFITATIIIKCRKINGCTKHLVYSLKGGSVVQVLYPYKWCTVRTSKHSAVRCCLFIRATGLQTKILHICTGNSADKDCTHMHGKLGLGDALVWRAHYCACADGIGQNWAYFSLG